jgi:2-polyprenyl-3-methyl-5-hydroxy-6-metoxy-1,4-benzoquinol methylase
MSSDRVRERPLVSIGEPSIADVREFWEEHPCGEDTATAEEPPEYFLDVERYRYTNAPFIPGAAEFSRFEGRRVLEIGCGIGTDGAQFALAGAEYVGVDLTQAAVDLARRNFAARGLNGDIEVADARELPFGAEAFDHVYSFGVIHHSPEPRRIVEEILRVLKPRGTVTVMLYNRTSINYYVEIMLLRKLGRLLLRPPPALLARALRLPRAKLERHREQLLRIPHPTPEQWVSMNTDGPDCPLARVYSAREARILFDGFDALETEVHHFDRSHWPYIGQLMSDSVADAIGARFGWCRIVRGRKPSQ